MKHQALLFSIAALAGTFSASLHATPISGTFDMSGIVTVTTTQMTFNSDVAPNLADMFTLSSGTDSFAGKDGQQGVNDLNIATEPVGSTFAEQPFIIVPGLPSLDINFIYAGTGGSADCTATPAVGQTCTPPNPGGSPFTFTNDNPPTAIQSSAQWVFSGVTSDGLSTWTANFTSQFNTPYQTVLAAFEPGNAGFVSNSYSATATVVVSPIPEPGPLALTAFGVIALAGFRRFLQGAVR